MSVNVGISIYPEGGITGEELIKASSLAIDNSSTEDKLSINYYSETLSLEAQEKTECSLCSKKPLTEMNFT